MRTSDIALTLLIIIIFVGLMTFNVLVVNVQKIKDNWPVYRCNPAVMPFSSTLGNIGPSENFTFCIQNMQSNFMDHLLMPVNYSLSIMGGLAGKFQNALNAIRYMFHFIRTFVQNIVESIYGIFLNILIEFQKVTMGIIDLVGKMTGIMTAMMFMMDGSIKTMKSIWKGPPGGMLRALCFHPDTTLTLKNGKQVKMKDINLGDVLKNGSVILGKLILKNTDISDGSIYSNKLYEIDGGEKQETIYVTGTHLVFDGTKFDYVRNYKHAKESVVNSKELSCLLTSDNKICIGDHVFWDYDDTPEMVANLK